MDEDKQRITVLTEALTNLLSVVRENCLDTLEAEARKYTEMGYAKLDAQDRAIYAEVMAAVEAAAAALAASGSDTGEAKRDLDDGGA